MNGKPAGESEHTARARWNTRPPVRRGSIWRPFASASPARADRSTGAASKSWPRPRTSSASWRTSFRDRRRLDRAPSDRRQFLQLMGASLALAGLERVHAAADREDRAVRAAARRDRAGRSHSSSPPRCRSAASPAGCWSRATWAGRRRSKATPSTRRASAPPMPSRRPRSSALYDPDRSQVITQRRRDPPVERLSGGHARGARRRNASNAAPGLRMLTETVTSPTLAEQLRQVLAAFPHAQWHQYEPVHRDNVRRRCARWRSARMSTHATTSTRPT